MLDRIRHRQRVAGLLRVSPVVALLGARQVGKTTLARALTEGRRGPVHYFDLEDPFDRARLEDARLTLGPLRGLVVLDEIHRVPGLFELLRVLADRPRTPARFLVLGSASPDLLRQSSETLAGRIAFHELGTLAIDEVTPSKWKRLWLRGGFPRATLARSLAESWRWRADFIRTFVERDLPGFGVQVAAAAFARLVAMLAHWHGQLWNASEFARSLAVSEPTVRRWLDLLDATFIVRLLRPYHVNLAKRQVRSPKVYVRDSGLLHALLGLREAADLDRHPKVGASFEGFALEQVLAATGAAPDERWFWATHQGAELDLLLVRGRRRLGFEFKRASAPTLTKSMRIALHDLGLDRLDVIYPGAEPYSLAERVRVVPVTGIFDFVA
jgi:hypothetical protein